MKFSKIKRKIIAKVKRNFCNTRCENVMCMDQVKKIIESGENVILLDVRSTQEYMEGHLPGAVSIPLYEFSEECIKKEIKDCNTIIVAYCRTGLRSKKAAEILRAMGYKNVYTLKQDC